MEKQTRNIPELRFPEFKTPWEHKPLHHYLKESKLLNTNLKYDKTEVLSVSGELGCVNQIEHLGRSYAGESVHNYGVVETGDIVYTKSPLKANPFGIIKQNKGKAGIVSTLYAVYKVKEENASGDFIEYYFSLVANTNRYLRPLVRKGAKNDMKINNAYVLHDKIFAPTITEQKRITTFLSVTDKRLSQLKEKKALLEQYKKGMMQKIFSQELRFKPALSEAEGDDNGNNFPDWEEKKLSALGKLMGGGTPDSSNEEYWRGDIPWISSSDIKENDINKLSITRYISKTALKESATKLVPKGAILIVSRVGIGKFAVANEEVCTSQDFTNFITVNCNSYFLAYYFSAKSNRFKSLSQGTSIKGFTGQDVRNLKFSIPNSIEEQDKIANFLSGVDHKISICQSKIEQTQQYKKSLLQKMFV